MEPTLLLRQFNDTIGLWISFLEHYTLEQLRQSPQPGYWSLGQVYTHIINDTDFYVVQMQEALVTSDNSDKTMHANGARLLQNNAFPDMKIEGPSTGVDIPQPPGKAVIKESLENIRSRVNELATTYDFANTIGKTAHPGFAFFTAAEWLQFAEMHMRHHLRQKQRIDEQLHFLKD